MSLVMLAYHMYTKILHLMHDMRYMRFSITSIDILTNVEIFHQVNLWQNQTLSFDHSQHDPVNSVLHSWRSQHLHILQTQNHEVYQ